MTLWQRAHQRRTTVRAFWRELYDKRPVDLPSFQAVLRPPCAPGPRRGMGPGPAVLHARRTAALDKADGKAPGPNHVEAGFLKALPAPAQWLLVHSYRAILPGAPPTTHWRDVHFWLSPKVPGSAKLYDYRPSALGQLYMKLLTGPLTQWITEVLTRHGVVSDWQQGALPGSNTGPPLFMAQRQLQRRRPKYVFSFDARKAFDTAPHGALHFILCHLSVPPAVIDIPLFVHTAARVRIATAHGLTQPVHMPRGVRQGKSESSPLYALLLEPLLRVQGHRLRPPGEAERGLIQAYIDDLLVVAHTLQHFVEDVEAVAAYLGMMGMELKRRKCAMATTEGIPGLHLRLCLHLETPWHWVPAAASVPYQGLQLQPTGILPAAQAPVPTGHAGQGDSVGPPHPNTRAHSTWVADPNSPPSGRAVGGGTAPDLRRPSQWWKEPPPGTPLRHPHSEQRRPARVHAVGPVLGPHARTDRIRNTRVTEPSCPLRRTGGWGRDSA